MTLLHTNFASGDLFSVGVGAGNEGVSGINEIADRVNFGGFDFPQPQVTDFITDSNLNIISGLVVGDNQSYSIVGSYNADLNPVQVFFSGTTLGSTIEYRYCYQAGSYGEFGTGSLISGTVFLS